jgi:hypothetical protein
MVDITPAPDTAVDVPWGVVIGSIVGLLMLFILGCFLNYCCTIYCYVTSSANGRPPFLYSLESVNRDCDTLACINISEKSIICCCPHLKEDVEKATIYPAGSTTVNVTNTRSLFTYKGIPACEHTHLQANEDSVGNALLPVYRGNNFM